MFHSDPKKTAMLVLHRAMGGEVKGHKYAAGGVVARKRKGVTDLLDGEQETEHHDHKPAGVMHKQSYAHGGEVGNYPDPHAGKENEGTSFGHKDGGHGNYPDPSAGEEEGEVPLHGYEAHNNYPDPEEHDQEEEHFAEGGEVDEGELMAAKELCEACQQGDPQAVLDAFKSLFQMMEVEPHEEYEHEEEY